MADQDTSLLPVEIGVLGPLAVVVRGAPVPVSRGATTVLLELLALDPAPITSASIASAVEASTGRSCTRATVHTSIWRLRRALGSEAAITNADGGYRLNPRLCVVDASTFERGITHAQQLARDHQFSAAAREFARAISLWRGHIDPSLSGAASLAARIVRLEDLRATAMEGWTDALRLAGQPDDAARILERLVVEHPLREHAWTALLQSYADSGRVAEARSAFDRARLHLAEHGLEPGAELHAALADLADRTPSRADPGARRFAEERLSEPSRVDRALDELVLCLSDAVEAIVQGLPGAQKGEEPDVDDQHAPARYAIARVRSARAAYASAIGEPLPRGRLR